MIRYFSFIIISVACFVMLHDEALCQKKKYKSFLLYGDDPELKTYEDTIECIEYLLKAKGNTQVNLYWNIQKQMENKDTIDRYISSRVLSHYPLITNQLAALYLISVLYHHTDTFTSMVEISYFGTDSAHVLAHKIIRNLKARPCRLCIFKKKGRDVKVYRYKVTDKRHLKKLYKIYNNWFELVKENGLTYMRETGQYPLKGTQYSWP